MAKEEVEPVSPSRRRPRIALITSLIIGLLAAGLVGALATREPAQNRQTASPLLGRAAPRIQGITIDGKSLNTDHIQGGWLLVNFFATWCIPCRREHPELVDFTRRHDKTGDASLVMVVYGDEVGAVRQWFSAKGGRWPVIADPTGRIALDYGVSGVPETFLVDPTGIVRAKLVGGVTSAGLDRILANLSR